MVFDQFKVESNLPLDLGTIKEHQELWLNSSIEEHLHLFQSVAVNFNVGVAMVVGCKVLVVTLDLGAYWVPAGMEIQASINGTVFVQILNYVVN